jgi:hypothetical protein
VCGGFVELHHLRMVAVSAAFSGASVCRKLVPVGWYWENNRSHSVGPEREDV